jgi:hypothetical protein
MRNQQVAITSFTFSIVIVFVEWFSRHRQRQFQGAKKFFFALFTKGKYSNYVLAFFFVIVSLEVAIDLPAVKRKIW